MDAAGNAAEVQPPAAPSTPARAEPLSAPRAAAPAEPPDVVVLPEFMRRAERRARWNRPIVKVALGVFSLLLAALLSLQITLHFRDALAALHPPLRAPLQALCGALDCEVHPWRRIEALSIDATSLSPVGSASYKLSLSLRNKSAVDVAAPWVELSLTDANGAPLARRVLPPDAMTPVHTQIAAESEQALSVSFSTGSQRVSGYSVNIFYP